MAIRELIVSTLTPPDAALRLADALIDVRDDVMECEQNIILEPRWRGLVPLTEDATWEDAFASLARFIHTTSCTSEPRRKRLVSNR